MVLLFLHCIFKASVICLCEWQFANARLFLLKVAQQKEFIMLEYLLYKAPPNWPGEFKKAINFLIRAYCT